MSSRAVKSTDNIEEKADEKDVKAGLTLAGISRLIARITVQ